MGTVPPAAPTHASEYPTRRTVARGAAWAVPVVAVGAAAPAASASPCQPTPVTFQVQIPPSQTTGRTSGPRAVDTLVVPEGVTTMTFTVLGGGGGYTGASIQNFPAGTGGAGALVTGTLTLVPGSTLTLVAGNGGIGAPRNQPAVAGGDGYGNGGDSADPSGATHSIVGGSGGGGSAILVDGVPAVVAGGGGGAAALLAHPATGWTVGGGTGGDAARQGTDATVRYRNLVGPNIGLAGGGATEGSPGRARGTSGSSNNGTDRTSRVVGNDGGAPGGTGPNGGGDGGRGVPGARWRLPQSGTYQCGSAGGGGGYAGGASGGAQSGVHNSPDNFYNFVLGGSGGGGSSHVSGQVSDVTIGSGNNGANNAVRHPGHVVVSYELPC